MTVIFNGTTNGGSNQVTTSPGAGDVFISGQSVGGRQPLDAKLLADVFGGTLTSTGTLKAGSDANDINDASITVQATGGKAFVFQQLEANNSFFGNFKPGQNGGREASAEAIEGKFTDLSRALNGAKILEDAGGNFEITISGGDVGGRVSTNGNFATQAEAQSFLDRLKFEATQPDAFGVVVADDDLDGEFVFEFQGSFNDTNNRSAIESRLDASNVVYDGNLETSAEAAAGNLALFLDKMATGGDAFVFTELGAAVSAAGNFGPSQNTAPGVGAAFVEGQITDLDKALTNARILQDAGGDFELRLTGSGVGGALNTNVDFDTAADADAFRDGLLEARAGFLDDALL